MPKCKGNTLVALGMNVMKAEKPALPNEYCPELRRLAHAMLEKDPAHRPDVAQVLQARFPALQVCIGTNLRSRSEPGSSQLVTHHVS